jgi:hypothetical protein
MVSVSTENLKMMVMLRNLLFCICKGNTDQQEITEPYDEEAEKAWRGNDALI